VTHFGPLRPVANENACAPISKDGPEHNALNQIPDPLMQDRKADRPLKTSCDAWPDHPDKSVDPPCGSTALADRGLHKHLGLPRDCA
jgi:hypothetical protein